MVARIATFEGGDLEELRRVNNELFVEGSSLPDGFRRVLVLEGESRRHVITFFESAEAAAEAEARFEELGDAIPESVRGRRVGLETFEVVFEVEAAH